MDEDEDVLHSLTDEFLFNDTAHSNEMYDCYLSKEELDECFAPPTNQWKDVTSTEVKTKVTIDQSKSQLWDEAKNEIKFVLQNLRTIIHKSSPNNDQDVTVEKAIIYIFGPNSEFGRTLQTLLNLTAKTYLEFICTFCIQAAYKVSSTQLFDPHSLLIHAVPMKKEVYNGIWNTLATSKRLNDGAYLGSGRRDKCIWEHLEDLANNICRQISISNHPGKISIALDDDKVWVNLTGRNKTDTFGIKYTTHVKPNRKGIVAHTAVSTGANLPLGIIFERKKDTTYICFERLLRFLFETNGDVDLRNVLIGSDRGYMLPTAVFEFLIKNGANVVGTTKRMLQCWPFTFDQQLKESDNRTKIDSKGPPTLFVKSVSSALKRVYAIAFRNGTESVTTAVSSIHCNHHWEGVALNQMELVQYEEDPVSLKAKCIQRINTNAFSDQEMIWEKESIQDLLDDRITPITLRQGENKYF